MAKVKIAIIGVGNIAETHIKAYQKNPDVEIYAFCDINEDRLKAMGEKYNVTRLYTDKEEMLKLAEIDAVSVCTWNSEHAPCTIAALNAGKHVLCEKPMATTVEDAEAMKAAAEKNGKLLMIGFVRRFGNDAEVLGDMIDADLMGDIYYAKTTYLRRHGSPGGWFGKKQFSGGGPLIDLGVHVIDLARYIMGGHKPVSVFGATFNKLGDRRGIKDKVGYLASSAKEGDEYNVEDMATALIRFDNGSVLSVEASFSLNCEADKGEIEFFGSKGGAKFSPELKMYTVTNGYMTDLSFVKNTALDFDGLFEKEMNHFVSCITEGTQCRATADDGITVMKILLGIYESAQTGHEVIL